MINKNWDYFIDEKVAINCKNSEQYEAFINKFKKEVNDEDLSYNTYMFLHHGSETCINIEDNGVTNIWRYCDVKYYEKHDYKIITFKEAMEILNSNEVKDLITCNDFQEALDEIEQQKTKLLDKMKEKGFYVNDSKVCKIISVDLAR